MRDKTTLPNSWYPKETHVALMKASGMDIEETTLAFESWAKNSNAASRNWDEEFTRWIRAHAPGGIDTRSNDEVIDDAQRRCTESQQANDRDRAGTEPHPLGDDGEKLFAEVLEGMKLNHARENNIPVGKTKCSECGEIRDWGDDPSCECELAASRRESARLREDRCRLALERIVPDGMRWAKFGEDGWSRIERAHPDLGKFARHWHRDAGSSLVLGPTGVGKTAACAALLQRILKQAAREDAPEWRCRFAYRMRFVDAPSLVVARRNSRLGSEADLIEQAKEASLLVIDELGFESQSAVPFEVLNSRYHAGVPTIITSGLKGKYRDDAGRYRHEFEERYGAAFLRRITERGSVIDLWKSRK